uniref:BatD family protein n=1 Tax=Candidatus Chordibacter forsetii TaxID=3381758 RepID=UPI00389A7EB8
VPSVRFELSFTVTPQREGTFIVPALQLNIEGKPYQAPAAKLSVVPPTQADKIRQAERRNQENNLKQAAFLEFKCPRPFLFKGETVEATVSLFLWDKLPVTRIDQVPLKIGDEISITELGQPNEERGVRRFKKSYSVYSWKLGLTGSLPGKHNISFSSSIRVRVRNNRNSRLSNPFFNDPFFGFGREESLEIKSQPQQLEIRPLPSLLRPTGFQGAIGKLSINSSLDTNRVSVGDPIKLTLTLSGSGNFAAMPAPKLSIGENFKVGPPAFSFQGNEVTMQKGSQTFEFVITPLQAGLLDIPPVTFSFFDPSEEKYFSIGSESHSIRVDPGEIWTDPNQNNLSTQNSVPAVSRQDLFQTESEPGQWVEILTTPKPFKSSIFWITQFGCTIAAASIMIFRIRRRNPKLELRKQKEKLLDGKIREALKHKDTSGFHQALRRKIRLRVGIACDQTNTSALSSSEIIKLLKRKQFSENVVADILDLLQVCDDLEYAQNPNNVTTLELVFKKASATLKNIK